MLPLISCKKSVQGFTLIEIIAVIVILSILAVLGGSFVVNSTDSYQTTQTRSRLVNTGRQAIERMSRQLRMALPYSVRITNDNMCVEFMPIASGGNYLGFLQSGIMKEDYVPDGLNGALGATIIVVSPHAIDFGTAHFVSIGAMDPIELYGTNPSSRATLSSRSDTQLILSAARVWQRNSVNKRFYLLNAPQAFCVVNNELRFYDNQDVTSASVDLTSIHSLLATNVVVTGAAPFALTAGAENRNTLVQFNIAFAHRTESVEFNHSVMIRNVP